MHSDSTISTYYTDWYKLEKETQKTIQKLSSMRELEFYLHNSNEYIRSLAILRINELKLKDALNALIEMLDNYSETVRNKQLAGWTIKKICRAHNENLFISNAYLSQFTGNESYSDIYIIKVNDFTPTIRFTFSSSYVQPILQLEDNNIHRNDCIYMETCFSFNIWIRTWLSACLTKWKKYSIAFFPLLWRTAKKLLLWFVLYILKKPSKILWQLTQKFFSRVKRYKMRKKYTLIKNIRRMSYIMLRLLFAPLRLVRKHKAFTFCAIAGFYCFLTLTSPGIFITKNYFTVDLTEFHSRACNNITQTLEYTWSEFKSATGMSKYLPESGKTLKENQVRPETNEELYRVIAKSGLNIRKEPYSTAAIITNIHNNAIITYLKQSHTDAADGTWYYIRTDDGITGWAYSKWLETIGGNTNAN